MSSHGTKKKEKKTNSKLGNIFANIKNLKNKNNEETKKIQKSSKLNSSKTIISDSNQRNNSQINSENDFFGFENLESPKEEDFGDFRIISNDSPELNPFPEIKSDIKENDLLDILILKKESESKKKIANIKSYITSIYFYKHTTKHKFDMKTFQNPCYIYDSSIKEILDDLKINNSNNFFLYMSYRSGLKNLKNVGCGNITSDCGWGCMLRSCQMMLSRAIIKSELYKLHKNKKAISNNDILNLKKEILCLFNDKFIPLTLLQNNRFLSNILDKYNGMENQYELIPPYSIYTLCKLNRSSGVYTSDTKIIKCFKEINEQLFINSFGIAHFENGIIQMKKLLETFCIKKDLTTIEEINYNKNDIDEDQTKKETMFDYYGEPFNFCKGGVVFISLRLGLRDLDQDYFDIIPLLFEKFQNNVGFVSGKKNKAFYFIGYNGDNTLIYADPHLNQKAEDFDISSYEVKSLYLLKIKDLSSGLTLGINIHNSNDLKIFINELNWFSKNYPNVINFK